MVICPWMLLFKGILVCRVRDCSNTPGYCYDSNVRRRVWLHVFSCVYTIFFISLASVTKATLILRLNKKNQITYQTSKHPNNQNVYVWAHLSPIRVVYRYHDMFEWYFVVHTIKLTHLCNISTHGNSLCLFHMCSISGNREIVKMKNVRKWRCKTDTLFNPLRADPEIFFVNWVKKTHLHPSTSRHDVNCIT